jgi:hypothetical protein
MTPGEFKEYARTMCEFGIVRLKMKDVHIVIKEIPLTPSPSLEQAEKNAYLISNSRSEADPIPHNIEQVASLLKLSDTDLVNRMFPDHRSDTEVSER